MGYWVKLKLIDMNTENVSTYAYVNTEEMLGFSINGDPSADFAGVIMFTDGSSEGLDKESVETLVAMLEQSGCLFKLNT